MKANEIGGGLYHTYSTFKDNFSIRQASMVGSIHLLRFLERFGCSTLFRTSFRSKERKLLCSTTLTTDFWNRNKSMYEWTRCTG